MSDSPSQAGRPSQDGSTPQHDITFWSPDQSSGDPAPVHGRPVPVSRPVQPVEAVQLPPEPTGESRPTPWDLPPQRVPAPPAPTAPSTAAASAANAAPPSAAPSQPVTQSAPATPTWAGPTQFIPTASPAAQPGPLTPSAPQPVPPQAGPAPQPAGQPSPQPATPPADQVPPWAPHAPQDVPPSTSIGNGQPWQPYPGVTPVPQQPYQEAAGVHRMPAPPAMPAPPPAPTAAPGEQAPPGQPAPPAWQSAADTPAVVAPTADDFARRRAVRPPAPVARSGVRAVLNRATFGLINLPPGRREREMAQDIERIRRNFGGLRQVTVVNPKGGAGKTVAILLLAMTFGQKRGGYVLAWDNNETQGTLGMRAQQDFHSRTVRDLLRDLDQFKGPHGRVGDLSQYVRSQGEAMFDVLASDESATAGEMLTATAFAEIRDVVSRFYKLIFVDTGNNVRAENWQAAIDATDQLVVTMSARNDSAETAARMLDHLEQSGRQRLVRHAVTVVSMPPSRKEINLPAIQQHFASRTRAVLLAPYERLVDSGEPIRYGELSSATREAWLKIAAAVAEGL